MQAGKDAGHREGKKKDDNDAGKEAGKDDQKAHSRKTKYRKAPKEDKDSKKRRSERLVPVKNLMHGAHLNQVTIDSKR